MLSGFVHARGTHNTYIKEMGYFNSNVNGCYRLQNIKIITKRHNVYKCLPFAIKKSLFHTKDNVEKVITGVPSSELLQSCRLRITKGNTVLSFWVYVVSKHSPPCKQDG